VFFVVLFDVNNLSAQGNLRVPAYIDS